MFSINTTTLCTFSRTHTVTSPARFWLCNTAFLCCWLLAVLVVVVCGVFCWWCCCCAVISYRSLPKLIFFVLVALDWSGRGLYVWLFVWALVWSYRRIYLDLGAAVVLTWHDVRYDACSGREHNFWWTTMVCFLCEPVHPSIHPSVPALTCLIYEMLSLLTISLEYYYFGAAGLGLVSGWLSFIIIVLSTADKEPVLVVMMLNQTSWIKYVFLAHSGHSFCV